MVAVPARWVNTVGKRRTANKGRSLAEPKALNLNPPLGSQIDRSASLLLATHLNFPTGTAEVLLETSGRTNTAVGGHWSWANHSFSAPTG